MRTKVGQSVTLAVLVLSACCLDAAGGGQWRGSGGGVRVGLGPAHDGEPGRGGAEGGGGGREGETGEIEAAMLADWLTVTDRGSTVVSHDLPNRSAPSCHARSSAHAVRGSAALAAGRHQGPHHTQDHERQGAARSHTRGARGRRAVRRVRLSAPARAGQGRPTVRHSHGSTTRPAASGATRPGLNG